MLESLFHKIAAGFNLATFLKRDSSTGVQRIQNAKFLRTSAFQIIWEYWKSLTDKGINLGNKEIPANLPKCASYHSFSTAHLPHDLYCVVSYPLMQYVKYYIKFYTIPDNYRTILKCLVFHEHKHVTSLSANYHVVKTI